MIYSPATVWALHRVMHLPVDLSQPILAHYPSLKMGVRDSVFQYANLLVPIIARLITTQPHFRDWVITSPALHVIPSAANLLSWQIYEQLSGQSPPEIKLSVINIREQNRFADPHANSHLFGDYSQLNLADRVQARQQSHRFVIEDQRFRDRAIIFINDIKVTGTQQQFLQTYFEQLQAAIVHWVYVINVEESIGAKEPKLESLINYSKYESLAEFAQLIAAKKIDYTSKFIWRLFSYSIPQLNHLFAGLETHKKQKILELVELEGCFRTGLNREKVERLRYYCQVDLKSSIGEI
jgi:hypothetical protein